MNKTTNYGLNIIETSDEIYDSLDAINENMEIIDEELKLPQYSLEEQEVGTWIDGRIIYKRTVALPNISEAQIMVDLGVTYTSCTYINIEGYTSDGSTCFFFPQIVNSSKNFIAVFVTKPQSSNNWHIIVRSDLDLSAHTGYVTLYYVKNT